MTSEKHREYREIYDDMLINIMIRHHVFYWFTWDEILINMSPCVFVGLHGINKMVKYGGISQIVMGICG